MHWARVMQPQAELPFVTAVNRSMPAHDARDRAPTAKASRPPARQPRGRLSLGVLADVLGYHIAQAAVTTYGTFERHVGEPFGLRKVEYSLLMLLLANGPLSPKRLGQALALSAPNLTLLLDRLQDRGLIRRERSATDGRSQNIVLTDAGPRNWPRQRRRCRDRWRTNCSTGSAAPSALMLIELLRKVAGPIALLSRAREAEAHRTRGTTRGSAACRLPSGSGRGRPRRRRAPERLAAGVHAQRDLVVLDAGLHVGGLLRLDELALEGGDLLGVVELHHVERLRGPCGYSVETTSTCGYHSTITVG